MNEISLSHTSLTFPDFTLVSASAGCGKTTALTRRFLQLLLSNNVPENRLPNILAVTFTHNAAAEMKGRILEQLKRAALSDARIVTDLHTMVSASPEDIRQRSEIALETIFDAYSDFQVQTIDSFIVRLIKVSSLEFALPPDFSIALSADPLLDEAFDGLAQELAQSSQLQVFLGEILPLLEDNAHSTQRHLWNPFEKLKGEVQKLFYRLNGDVEAIRIDRDTSRSAQQIGAEILNRICTIGTVTARPGINVSSRYKDLIALAQQGDLQSLLDRKLNQKVLNKSESVHLPEVERKVTQIQHEIEEFLGRYYELKAASYYVPYVKVLRMLSDSLKRIRRTQQEAYLGDVTHELAKSMRSESVPEVYFSLGERIHHYLIDEFQDTSPAQWSILRPLVENALAQQGSFFIVGDTKQSIYTFRGADWQIMRRLLYQREFASVETRKTPLEINWRSTGSIVEFSQKVFHEVIPSVIPVSIADLSGLSSSKLQAQSDAVGKGYVQVLQFDKETGAQGGIDLPEQPERASLIQILRDCRARGYRYSDIAILTPKNAHVVEVSRWLNAEGIHFLSHSSLDVRSRKLTGELLALLQFLDAPIDDLAFATVVSGDVFAANIGKSSFDHHTIMHQWRNGDDHGIPAYAFFRRRELSLWKLYFEDLFSMVGYLSVYDLVVQIYSTFHLLEKFIEEESTLVKFLEVVRNFVHQGNNNLKDFLDYALTSNEGEEWNIEAAGQEDAVTVMTVHKAKGLGFPVLLVLFYDSKRMPENQFLVETENGSRLYRITKSWAEKSESLNSYYQKNQVLAQVDELNKLYVALTRAKDEMHVLCVKSRYGDTPSSYLPPNGFTLGRAEHCKTVQKISSAQPLPLYYPNVRTIPVTQNPPALPKSEAERGEFIHALLSRVRWLSPDINAQLSKLISELPAIDNRAMSRNVINEIAEFLRLPEMQEFFTQCPEREVLTECEIVNKGGYLFRLDRLLVDPVNVTVLEFKTGKEESAHKIQLLDYLSIVKQIYPLRKVTGIIGYVDLLKTVKV